MTDMLQQLMQLASSPQGQQMIGQVMQSPMGQAIAQQLMGGGGGQDPRARMASAQEGSLANPAMRYTGRAPAMMGPGYGGDMTDEQVGPEDSMAGQADLGMPARPGQRMDYDEPQRPSKLPMSTEEELAMAQKGMGGPTPEDIQMLMEDPSPMVIRSFAAKFGEDVLREIMGGRSSGKYTGKTSNKDYESDDVDAELDKEGDYEDE
jgi:hypothetical protein